MIALIADDDVFVRRCMMQMIPWQELDFSQVLEAENGVVALRMALEQKPDLIITDVKMPVLNGLELAEKLRESVVDNCIVMLSEYRDFEFARRALTCGVQDYILKPITRQRLEEISERIHHLMEELEKKRYYTALKANPDGVQKLVHDMLETAAAKEGTDAFEYIALHQIHIEDLKRFGLMVLDELFEQTKASAFQKSEIAEVRRRAFDAYATLKNVTDVIAFVKEQCARCTALSARRAPHAVNYVTQIDDYIEKHYGDPALSVASVSDWLHLSPVYCGALYKQQRGKSIITSIHEVRMRHAKEMLQDGTINVATVSKRVGYITPDYFSRLFSANVGVSPSQYRAMMAVSQNKPK